MSLLLSIWIVDSIFGTLPQQRPNENESIGAKLRGGVGHDYVFRVTQTVHTFPYFVYPSGCLCFFRFAPLLCGVFFFIAPFVYRFHLLYKRGKSWNDTWNFYKLCGREREKYVSIKVVKRLKMLFLWKMNCNKLKQLLFETL